jgi:hypothetical protein
MKDHILRRCVDIVIFQVLCFVAGTGLLIGYRLAPCSQGGDDGSNLWGLGRHDWGNLHLWLAYVLIGLLVVHLVLNFSFIRNVIVSKNLLRYNQSRYLRIQILNFFSLICVQLIRVLRARATEILISLPFSIVFLTLKPKTLAILSKETL